MLIIQYHCVSDANSSFVLVAGRRPSHALNDLWDTAQIAGEVMIHSVDLAGYENCPPLKQMQDFTKNKKKKLLSGCTA